MAPERETIMVLKVDLDCERCYRKVKCLLCQYPQIQDQIYNEKQNTVTIRVMCCSPEKILDKLARKGGKSIKGIEIVQPKKPAPPPEKPAADKPPSKPPAEKPKDAPPPAADKPKQAPPPAADKPKQAPPPAAEKPKDAPPPADAKPAKSGSKNGSKKPDEPAPKPKDAEAAPKPAEGKKLDAPKPAAAPAPVAQADPNQYYPGYPVSVSCWECYQSGRSGPCYHGYASGSGSSSGFGPGYEYGVPVPPMAAPGGGYGYYGGAPSGGYGGPSDGYGGPSASYGGGYGGYGGSSYKPGYCVSRCGEVVNDDNPAGCVIM